MSIFNNIDSNLSANEIKSLNLPTTRKAQYWDIIKTQFNNLTKVNLLTMLFCLPLLFIVIFLIPSSSTVAGSDYNFVGNIGIGYPGYTDSIIQAEIEVLSAELFMYLLMIPALAIAGPGIAGLMRVLRNMVWGEPVSIRVDFWKGLKEDWKQYTLLTTLIGIFLHAMVYNISSQHIATLAGELTWVHTLGYVLSIIAIVLLVMMLIYLMPMITMYRNKFFVHVKNSILLLIAMLPMTILMTAIVGVVILLTQLSVLGVYVSMLLFIFGFALLPLMWTTYVQYVMDKHINVREHNKAYNRGLYKATEGETTAPKKPTKSKRYVNPKKLKKEATITPLSPTFRREDLARLQEEKDNLVDDSDVVVDDSETGEDNG